MLFFNYINPREAAMLIDSNQITSMTEANQNFSKVAKAAEDNGCVVIFKNNRPKYILMDIESCRLNLARTDERLDKAAKREISKAKWL